MNRKTISTDKTVKKTTSLPSFDDSYTWIDEIVMQQIKKEEERKDNADTYFVNVMALGI